MKRLLVCLLLVGVVGCEKSEQVKEQPSENSKESAPASAQNNPNLSACPDCGGKVSKLAAACPHCGRPLKQTEPTAKDFDKTVVPESKRQTLDEFGRLAFKAIQNLNAVELQALHLQFSDLELLKKRLEQAVTDPRKKSVVGQLPIFELLRQGREEFDDFQKDMNKGVARFVNDVKSGSGNISAAELAKSTYLGIVPGPVRENQDKDPFVKMVEELGVDASEAGVAVYRSPAIFFRSDGKLFGIDLNEFLLKLNHVWCLSGDAGMGIPVLLDSEYKDNIALRAYYPVWPPDEVPRGDKGR